MPMARWCAITRRPERAGRLVSFCFASRAPPVGVLVDVDDGLRRGGSSGDGRAKMRAAVPRKEVATGERREFMGRKGQRRCSAWRLSRVARAAFEFGALAMGRLPMPDFRNLVEERVDLGHRRVVGRRGNGWRRLSAGGPEQDANLGLRLKEA